MSIRSSLVSMRNILARNSSSSDTLYSKEEFNMREIKDELAHLSGKIMGIRSIAEFKINYALNSPLYSLEEKIEFLESVDDNLIDVDAFIPDWLSNEIDMYDFVEYLGKDSVITPERFIGYIKSNFNEDFQKEIFQKYFKDGKLSFILDW
ncbi:hypothetical protein Ab1vBOLIVR5_gp14 [Agrobacterium phage OLIVR5]|uniref:Uncharacterized protein n=1 Tax=Agrobacterium phage OLIVR5 TaxID=2723773 RepID=A0A858MSD7_9CAUD|nr:hypothetical protein KNU99_gp014 [Agrobacterium phage OLIVR5]QIW87662.1 hypothetical protein Ab1vBOLIVR5_gp14 [Agrobacterium phage OLIVR5]QIW87921.1 hypothetical protein Ab1vBOLIVR6_gp14 [Agrobacterium phage OLIVR6]